MTCTLKYSGVVLALAIMASQPASAISLSFDPLNQSVNVGDTVTENVQVTGLNNQLISAYDFLVNWDNSILSLTGIAFNPDFVGDAGVTTTGTDPDPVTSATDYLEAFAFISGNIVNQNGTSDVGLFTLTYKALAAGVSPLSFSDNPVGGSLVDQDSALIAGVNYGTGSVTVIGGHPVPEPTIMLLMVAGFLGFVASSRKINGFSASRIDGNRWGRIDGVSF